MSWLLLLAERQQPQRQTACCSVENYRNPGDIQMYITISMESTSGQEIALFPSVVSLSHCIVMKRLLHPSPTNVEFLKAESRNTIVLFLSHLQPLGSHRHSRAKGQWPLRGTWCHIVSLAITGELCVNYTGLSTLEEV